MENKTSLGAAPPILQTVPLDFRWPALSPFLFCVHHVDHYPPANDSLGPDASLAGRDIGQDFAGIDNWRMYHGDTVPGFPGHPHRGFETVTYVRRGLIDHADSKGASARYGRGDVQWLTAGSGVQHAEMFPLLDQEGPNPLELFQIWLNLPAEDKSADAFFEMFWDGDIPRVTAEGVSVTVIAGALEGLTPPQPPPHSWAARPDTDVAIWHIVMDPGSTWTLPPARFEDTGRVLYLFEGEGIEISGQGISARTGAVLDPTRAATLTSTGHTEMLILQGRPIDEPVATHGPFVMNTQDEIVQAFEDYRRTQFGGWPWDRPDPVHGTDPAHFARYPDGTVRRPGL
ncbi:MAG: pirin family protein [Nostocoides sp.]